MSLIWSVLIIATLYYFGVLELVMWTGFAAVLIWAFFE